MKRITFFVGPNGCGKTRQLVHLAQSFIGYPDQRRSAAAVANTPFVRFRGRGDLLSVFRVSPAGINRVVSENLEQFFDAEGRDTFDVSDLLETVGFRSEVDLEMRINTRNRVSLDEISAEPNELDAIWSALEAIGSERLVRLRLSRSSDSFTHSLRGRNRIVFKYIRELKRAKIVTSYSLVFYHPDRGPQKFKELSSGEQTLISTYLFVKSKLPDLRVLFIDEPENSLHPEWQRRYLEMLHMALGYQEARIFLASHSPVLVSGALSSYGYEVDIVRVDGNNTQRVDVRGTKGSESVEEILWEAFNTITPVSHFLSVELSRILQEFTDGGISHEMAAMKIQDFQNQSYDRKQQKLLQNVLENLSEFDPNARTD